MADIEVRDVVAGTAVKFNNHESVRFRITPPLCHSGPRPSKIIRLNNSEGWIDVYLEDGGVRIQAPHEISIEPRASNTVHIRMTDVREHI